MENEQITIHRHRLSDLTVCDVTTDELDAIQREGNNVGLDFQIAEGCLTIAFSFLAALLSVKIDSLRVFTVFVLITMVGFFVGLAFGIKWFQSRGTFTKLVQRIRDRQVGPMGDEKQQLRPKDLEALPLGPTGPFAPPPPSLPPESTTLVTESVPATAPPGQSMSEEK